MKKIILILGITITSCQSERIIVKVKTPIKTLEMDINESIVQDFYGGDTLGKKIYLVK